MKTFHIGGVHPKDNKLNAEAPALDLPAQKELCIMVSQHLGAPSTVIVKKGDRVKMGQVLTENKAFLGANVHAPACGTVSKIGEALDASNYLKPAIFLDVESDQAEEGIDLSPKLQRDISLTSEEIIERIKEMGIVGLGGACFPTHIKLTVPPGQKAEVLLINGVECEPYLIDDYRLMLDKAQEIMVGIEVEMKALNVDRALIGIEANKPKAIEYLSRIASSFKGISVVPLKMKYPQGAEKQLIRALTGKEVPSGKLPIHTGCVVSNVSTCYAIYEAVQKHKPLIERLVTVTGPSVPEPRNFRVKIGTPISALIEAIGGLPKGTGKVIAGGPMMGKALHSLETPINKGISAILLLPEKEAHRGKIEACIRCGKCVEACPMGLEPYYLNATVEHQRLDLTERAHIMDCIECGCCQFTCPSYRPLLDTLRMGKATVGKVIKNRNIQPK